jgi:DNA-binding transcriptional LysR family regulator
MERSGELEVFLRVVREGGFSAAARSVGLTPSAVSKLISRLEARLGARLFTRTTRALSLTEEGEAYYQAGQRILQELDAAEQAAAAGAVRGRLRVNASLPFGTRFVAPALPAFLARHPEVIVDLSLTDDVIDLLAQRTDIAIRVGDLPDSALLAQKLGQSRRVLSASPAYLKRKGTPTTPDALQHHDCLTFNFRRGRGGWPFREAGGVTQRSVSGSVQVNNGETLKQLLLEGAGIGRLALWHVAPEFKTGRLVPLLEKYNPGDLEQVHAIHVGGGQVPPRVRAFITHMVNTMKASPLAD